MQILKKNFELMLKKNIILLVAILCGCLFSGSAFAQKKAAFDSSFIHQRLFSDSSINAYKNNRDFEYEKWKEPPKSIWDRFWSWVWLKWEEIMSTESGRNTVWTLFVVFGSAMIAFFIWKTRTMTKMSLFEADKKANLKYDISEESIHTISFEEAIQRAIENNNYRLAIRLLYLQTLKKLNDKQFINWHQNKTNFAYVKELQQNQLQQGFANLTDLFEYAWYGNNSITKNRFEEIKNHFQAFQYQL